MRAPSSGTFGLITPLVTVVVTGVVLWLLAVPGIFFGGVITSQLVATAWLYLLLIAACTLWLGLHHVMRLPTGTAAGFGVAALALSVRGMCEFQVWMFDYACYPYRPGELGAALSMRIELCRVGGLIAYVFGLAIVVASAIAEWRLRRDAPDWALPE